MSGPSRNTKTTVAAIKLGIFVLVSVIVTGTLTAIMGSFSFGSETEYKAVFSSASMIKKGDDVRVAGVSAGSVKKVEILNRDQAEITFKVKKDVPVTTATRASIRFLNLVGDRYMALEQGAPGAKRLPDDGTIPLAHTTPALNLTELFNGFQPLFQALQPHEVNQLSLNLVKVLQGEGGTVNSLLGNTASLTNALADRDQLIGQVIENLSALLKTTDDHHTQLSSLIVQLKDWMTNLSADRKTIGASITNLSGLTAEVAKLLTAGTALHQGRRRPGTSHDGDPEQAEEPAGAQRGDQPAPDDAAAPGAGRQLRQLVPVLPLRHRRQDHHAEVQRPGDRRTCWGRSRHS